MLDLVAERPTLDQFISLEELLERPKEPQIALAIDCVDPHEVDDAIVVEQVGKNDYRVATHLADSTVLRNSPLLDSAYEQGWSVYDGSNPQTMLAREVSRDTLSLDKGGPEGAPSIAIEYGFDKVSRLIGDVSIYLARVECETTTFEEFGIRHDEHDPIIRAIRQVAVMLNMPPGEKDFFPRSMLARLSVKQFTRRANKIATRKADKIRQKDDFPWIYRVQGGQAYNLIPEEDHRDIFEMHQMAFFSSRPFRHEQLGARSASQFTGGLRRWMALVDQMQYSAYLQGKSLPFTQEQLDQFVREKRAQFMQRSPHFQSRLGETALLPAV